MELSALTCTYVSSPLFSGLILQLLKKLDQCNFYFCNPQFCLKCNLFHAVDEGRMLKLVKTESNKAGSEQVLEGIDGHGKSVYTDEAWAPSEVLHEPPLLKVTQPKGSFCTIDARFAVSLDPDGVYDIIIDPNNRHVFKNIKV